MVRDYFFISAFNGSNAAVAKAVKCEVSTMKYWLKRWRQSKDLRNSNWSDRLRGTTSKQNEQIASLTEQQTFVTTRGIAKKFSVRQELRSISGRTIL